jgi:membrane protease YdiL (CAAX protease family)
LRTLLRIVIAILLGVLALGISGGLAMMAQTGGLISSDRLPPGVLMQIGILLVSLLLISALAHGRFDAYGFRQITKSQLRTSFLWASAVAIIMAALEVLYLKHFPPSGSHPGVPDSLLQTILGIVILASVSEEVLYRGLIQSFLAPLRASGRTLLRVRLTLPVMVSGIFFGLAHLMLLTMGTDPTLVAWIVVSATVLGIVAGYLREQTGSLIPAIMVHMLFNAYNIITARLLHLGID